MYPQEVADLIVQYRSPENEVSLVKGVPINLYSRDLMKGLRNVFGPGLTVMFRGPRAYRNLPYRKAWWGHVQYRPGQSYCLKRDAVTFAVYRR